MLPLRTAHTVIATVRGAIDAAIAALLAKARPITQGMMQDLLAGGYGGWDRPLQGGGGEGQCSLGLITARCYVLHPAGAGQR